MSEPSPLDTVRHVAALARLSLEEHELASMAQQFERTLASFRVLAGVDVAGVEPMTSASGGENVLRDDEPRPSLTADEALANAPARVEDFYRVPKTVGGDE